MSKLSTTPQSAREIGRNIPLIEVAKRLRQLAR